MNCTYCGLEETASCCLKSEYRDFDEVVSFYKLNDPQFSIYMMLIGEEAFYDVISFAGHMLHLKDDITDVTVTKIFLEANYSTRLKNAELVTPVLGELTHSYSSRLEDVIQNQLTSNTGRIRLVTELELLISNWKVHYNSDELELLSFPLENIA